MARRARSAALLTALLLLLAAAAVAGARQEPAAAPPPKAEPRERKVPVCHYDAETDSYALLMVAVSGWQVRGQAAFIRARDAPSLCACCYAHDRRALDLISYIRAPTPSLALPVSFCRRATLSTSATAACRARHPSARWASTST